MGKKPPEASDRPILVTGGAGFIGSHVVDALLAAAAPPPVVVLDDLSSGRRENVDPRARLEVLDVRDAGAAALVRQLRPRVIYHLAAQMDVRRSVADPRFDAEVNILGLLNLLEAARESDVNRVVFASTGGAMYGDQRRFPADETHPAQPLSPYGVAKLAAERYLYFYQREHGVDAVCLRYANVYGPRQNPHGEAGVVAIFCDRLLAGEPATIYGDGEQTRDYVFVADVVCATVAAGVHRGFAVLNVGTGRETSVNLLWQQLTAALGVDARPTRAPARAGEQQRSCISSRQLAQLLGVTPATGLEEGLSRTASWFRQRASSGR